MCRSKAYAFNLNSGWTFIVFFFSLRRIPNAMAPAHVTATAIARLKIMEFEKVGKTIWTRFFFSAKTHAFGRGSVTGSFSDLTWL